MYQDSVLHMAKMWLVWKTDHFKKVCRSIYWQHQEWQCRRALHKISEEDESDRESHEEQDRSFDAVRVNMLTLIV